MSEPRNVRCIRGTDDMPKDFADLPPDAQQQIADYEKYLVALEQGKTRLDFSAFRAALRGGTS